jgi:aerobic carbon-monoxide dehydrogenase medium subunit
MKPAAFEYHRPTAIAEALQLLADLGDEAKPLAGGQSLVPLMNFRLARPAHLVDLNRVDDLRALRTENGELRIGAMTRQRQLERSAHAAGDWSLLGEAIRYIGHVQIRNRGTIGGSLAHADPAAELPAVMTALDAQIVVRSARGERTVPAGAFFASAYTTVLEPDELLVEIRVPAPARRTGAAFQEVSSRHGDFALVGVAATVSLDDAGAIDSARLVFTGAGDAPIRSQGAEQSLVGQRPGEPAFREAGRLATADLDPVSDIHATADYRTKVAAVLARRALTLAAERAAGRS